MAQSPIVYGHRGASTELPENTIEAFARALQVGAGAIETDVHVTRDGVPVLHHDATGAATAFDGRAIASLTAGEVAEWDVSLAFRASRVASLPSAVAYRVPRLDAALEALPEAFFNIDIKPTEPAATDAVLAVVRRAGAQSRVRLASFSTAVLRRVRSLGYRGPTSLTVSEVLRALTLPPIVARIEGSAAQIPTRYHGVPLATQRVIDRLHGVGARVDFWVVNDPDHAKRLVAMGADGIVTDDPRTIARALGVGRA